MSDLFYGKVFDPERSDRPQVWSSGGGTQSAAIAALIVAGKVPKPDLAMIADTGREASEVWRYHDSIVVPALRSVGVELHRIPHTFDPDNDPGYNTVDLYTGADGETLILPVFTDHSGDVGRLPKYCSNEWKSRVCQRFARERGIRKCDVWIGFSLDEAVTRARRDVDAVWRHVYPLIELGMSRQDSIALVEEMGWPTPPRSSCKMCPYRSDAEWLHMKAVDPLDFEYAKALERKLQKRDSNVYLHRSCKPLSEVEFSEKRAGPAVGCQSGMCFT